LAFCAEEDHRSKSNLFIKKPSTTGWFFLTLKIYHLRTEAKRKAELKHGIVSQIKFFETWIDFFNRFDSVLEKSKSNLLKTQPIAKIFPL